MTHTTRAPARRITSLVSLFVLLLASALVLVGGTQSAQADGQLKPGNQNCADVIAGSLELRVNAPADGTFSSGAFSVVVDVQTLGSDDPAHPGNQTGSQVFDFTASGGSVIGVAVKGGPDTNFYDYRPAGVSSGNDLHAPLNSNNKFYGLSHISFCYVPKASPTIETLVSDDDLVIGGSFHDVATLAGGNNPTGTITFALYGPDDATCAGTPVFTDEVAVNGNGDYPSDPYTPTAVGTYHWIASYGGDAGNNAVSGACNDAGENVVVRKAQPAIETMVSAASGTIGASFTDTATLSGGVAPTGTITFDVYGPNDATCSGAVVFTDDVTVDAGNADYPSAAFMPLVPGKYRWTASYSGDAQNEAVSGACNDANEDATVNPFQPTMGLENWLAPQARANVNLIANPANGKIGDNSAPPEDTTADVRIVLYEGDGCDGAVIHDQGFQVNPDGLTTQTFTTNNTTLVEITSDVSWSWKAFYEGDAVSNPLETNCQNVVAAFSEF
jgi:hypothetical protein